jgi:hypothetical protein
MLLNDGWVFIVAVVVTSCIQFSVLKNICGNCGGVMVVVVVWVVAETAHLPHTTTRPTRPDRTLRGLGCGGNDTPATYHHPDLHPTRHCALIHHRRP